MHWWYLRGNENVCFESSYLRGLSTCYKPKHSSKLAEVKQRRLKNPIYKSHYRIFNTYKPRKEPNQYQKLFLVYLVFFYLSFKEKKISYYDKEIISGTNNLSCYFRHCLGRYASSSHDVRRWAVDELWFCYCRCYKEVRFEALVGMVAPIFFAAVQEGAAMAKLPRQTSSCFGRELIRYASYVVFQNQHITYACKIEEPT